MKINNYKQFINESIKYGDLEYDSEWKLPINPIRIELEKYLNQFLLEIKDLGYSTQISGFIKSSLRSSPFIWICKKQGIKRFNIIWK